MARTAFPASAPLKGHLRHLHHRMCRGSSTRRPSHREVTMDSTQMHGTKISAFGSTPMSSPVVSPRSLRIRVQLRGRCIKGRLSTSTAPVVAGNVPRDVSLSAPGLEMTRTGRIGLNVRRRAAVMVTTRTTRTNTSRKSRALKLVCGEKKSVSGLNQKVVCTAVLVFRPMQSKLKKLVYKFRCRQL